MRDQAATSWAQRLGFVGTSLFGRERADPDEQHFALLDGVRASFLLSRELEDFEAAEAADWAWSSNVLHHVSIKQDQVVVSKTSGAKETFVRRTVESKLADFLRYLESDASSIQAVGAIDHLVQVFRKHRTNLPGNGKNAVPALQSFLYLLAIAPERDVLAAHRDSAAIVEKYHLNFFDPKKLTDDYIRRFIEEITLNKASMRHLLTPLTIRHAGGNLFQEAHAELLSGPFQATLFGLADAASQRLDLSLGVYYTPPGLARTLTELAIEPQLGRGVIRINDPACGSGIFLCEAIRVLQRNGYKGKVYLSGRDISPHAVQMARFSVACALLDWADHQVQWLIGQGSFADVRDEQGEFDVIVMNPPFQSWEQLDSRRKDLVRSILGSSFGGKPDLSTAFIHYSLSKLSAGGTLASLVPRGVLDSERGKRWRDAILANNDVRLLGSFGEHALFRHAMVSIGAMILEHRRGDGTAVMVWADQRTNSADSALRALRRQRLSSNLREERTANWSIYSIRKHELNRRKSWAPSPNALGALLDIIKEQNLPKVADLFTVRQGIKTGFNEAFLLFDNQLRALPASEQQYFRRVAGGEDIWEGSLHSQRYMFYAPGRFQTKKELLDELPVFGKELVRHEPALRRRRSNLDTRRWWEPVRPRKDLAERMPRILTKMFGGPNMSAPDFAGDYLPLQAFAWMPNWPALGIGSGLEEATLWWYCRVLNSRIFFLLRRDIAAALTAGGQLDVSPKYVNDVPLPLPKLDDLIQLASEGQPNLTASKGNDDLVAVSYGSTRDQWPLYAA